MIASPSFTSTRNMALTMFCISEEETDRNMNSFFSVSLSSSFSVSVFGMIRSFDTLSFS